MEQITNENKRKIQINLIFTKNIIINESYLICVAEASAAQAPRGLVHIGAGPAENAPAPGSAM